MAVGGAVEATDRPIFPVDRLVLLTLPLESVDRHYGCPCLLA